MRLAGKYTLYIYIWEGTISRACQLSALVCATLTRICIYIWLNFESFISTASHTRTLPHGYERNMRLCVTAIQFPKCHSIRLEARAEISGPPIRYLTPGSALRLQCRVVQNTEASEYIFWYHDNRMINYDIDRGINVSTEPGMFRSNRKPLPLSLSDHVFFSLSLLSLSLQTFNHRSSRFNAPVASIRAISPAWPATHNLPAYWCTFSKVCMNMYVNIAYRIVCQPMRRILNAAAMQCCMPAKAFKAFHACQWQRFMQSNKNKWK